MYYASFAILAVLFHIIINYKIIKSHIDRTTQESYYRYKQFLFAILVFYIADLLWGFFEEAKIRALVYADTWLFFATMALSVLLWTRFVVAFLDKSGTFSKIFIGGGWVIFGFVILHLIINFFNPVIFEFTEIAEYIPGSGRYILLVAQLLLFLSTTVYTLYYSVKSTDSDKIHYIAICASGGAMSILIVLQTFYPFVPFYTIGCLLANCIVHVFIEEDNALTAKTAIMEKQMAQKKFSQIAESLASNYDVIYYVDVTTDEYIGYTSRNIYGEFKVEESGEDFFEEAAKNVEIIIHPKDRERIRVALDKDYLITTLEDKKQLSAEYRQMIDGNIHHTRFTVRKSSDEDHLIICVENIDEEVRKEKDHLKALKTEKELARRDELTGTRNKTAFNELEKSVQENIDKGMDYQPFAIAVCDLNNLKKINDTKGHKAGDEYIKESAKILCDAFKHSPVFRIGGDEFAVFLRGEDFTSRDEIVANLHKQTITNLDKYDGPVIAVGIADFNPREDTSVTEIFDRADHLMYEDKYKLKHLNK